jgi:hypothetical protein
MIQNYAGAFYSGAAVSGDLIEAPNTGGIPQPEGPAKAQALQDNTV